MSETTTTAPVIVAHALVPVSLRIDMSTGEGARFAQLVPEDQRDEYMHRFIYDHVRDLLRAGSQGATASGPTLRARSGRGPCW